MVRALDVRTALYGINHDLNEKLTKSDNPMEVLGWLQHRVSNVYKTIDMIERYNKNRKEVQKNGNY